MTWGVTRCPSVCPSDTKGLKKLKVLIYLLNKTSPSLRVKVNGFNCWMINTIFFFSISGAMFYDTERKRTQNRMIAELCIEKIDWKKKRRLLTVLTPISRVSFCTLALIDSNAFSPIQASSARLYKIQVYNPLFSDDLNIF